MLRQLEKMSKSRGNVISVDDILGRLVCPSCGYRDGGAPYVRGEAPSPWAWEGKEPVCPRCLAHGEHVVAIASSARRLKPCC